MTGGASRPGGSSPRRGGSGRDGPVPVIDVLLPGLEPRPTAGGDDRESVVDATIIRAVTAGTR